MSYIRLPDPHPGRCRNMRFFEPQLKWERCLDYEGTDHVCTFADPGPVTVGTKIAQAFTDADTSKPKAWVKP